MNEEALPPADDLDGLDPEACWASSTGKHMFLDEYAACYFCGEVSYRDVYGWFGD